MKVDDNFIRNVRESNDIVDVIGGYLPLVQKGKNYFCVCPFHDDHSPSMSISKEKQIYKCFVCGETGNVITFVKDYLSISFLEAVEVLAKRSGINFKLDKPKVNDKFKEDYEIYSIALSYYKNNLNTKEGENARNYLKKRGITKEAIDYFDIGLSLGSGLVNSLSKKYNIGKLENIGLSSNNKDLFINRIMFTIRDNIGNPVGFSGRKYDDSDAPKYINTKETDIFKKGSILFNYYRAKDEIRRKKEIIISEGQMEVIRCHIVGINNIVALMGTAFTKEHLSIIKKERVNVVLNLDQDDAGKLATINIGKTLVENGINPTVIVFSKYKDTDELILNEGKEAFIKAYDNRVNFVDFELNYLKKNVDLSNTLEVSNYINESINVINEINDDVLRELKVRELSKEFDISTELIKSKLQMKDNNKVIVKKSAKNVVKKRYNGDDMSELRILHLMLNYPEVITIYERQLGYLNDENRKNLADAIINYKESHKMFDYADFICYTNVREDLTRVIKEVESYPLNNVESISYSNEELEDYINKVKRKRVKMLQNERTLKINDSIDVSEKEELTNKFLETKKEVLKW